MEVLRFSDFATEARPLDGKKVRIDDILNLEILITGHALKNSKYPKNVSGLCLTIQFRLDGELCVTFTGSDVLIDQFKKYGDNIPFVATIKKN